MCVICYVPRGVRLPSKETIKNMWDRNSHGAGVMYKTQDNKVFYKKGYFDFETFYNDLLKISDKAVEIGIHCRIATSGGINQEMCHPFPITTDIDRLKAPFGNQCDRPLVMHNGVIADKGKYGLNDTCAYIIDKLLPRYITSPAFMYNNKIVKRIQNEIGSSKLLIMSEFPTKMIGNWTKDSDGCYYSNLYFKPFSYSRYYGTRNNVNSVRKSNNRYMNKYDLFDSYAYIYE